MVVKNRLKYIDTLKVLAIISVISLHAWNMWWGKPIFDLDFFRVISELARFGVPIFLMITGALLLNRDIELKAFLKKKWVRLCYPFVFYLIIRFLASLHYFDIFIHNWYFWMIFCLFLAIPIINKFILHSSSKELEYFVLLIVISSIVYQLLCFTGIRNFIDLGFFMGPVSYLILGYYFSIKNFKMKSNRIVTICLLLFIIVTCIKMAGVADFIPVDLVRNVKATNTEIIASWLDVGIFEIIQASSLFVLVRYLYECDSGICGAIKNVLEIDWINRFFISVSCASYGMYLINATFMFFCNKYFKHLSLTSKRMVFYSLIIIAGIFLLSWIFVVCVSRIPKLKKFSGYS